MGNRKEEGAEGGESGPEEIRGEIQGRKEKGSLGEELNVQGRSGVKERR